jgi:glycosyltransferase involved in cell wall biosynthesis
MLTCFARPRYKCFGCGTLGLFRKRSEERAVSTTPRATSEELPVHFFTIVLNGEPFIRYHAPVFERLPFRWHWHVVEGVAALRHDTAWSVARGGQITDAFHSQYRSNDGSTEYLDAIRDTHPNQITIYRKPAGEMWDGKREMVNAPLVNIQEECLLWQVDADELWTAEQIITAREMFQEEPGRTSAYYWCWYFVGEQLVVTTRNCYSQDPGQEWLRTWRYRPGMRWLAHEPPRLGLPGTTNAGTAYPFSHEETERRGLVFQHFAYVTPEQLLFKEEYYGYRNAFIEWSRLQRARFLPARLRDYFSWVTDEARVDRLASRAIVPLATRDSETGAWAFGATQPAVPSNPQSRPARVVVDGVFFQMASTGIARVWRSFLDEWSQDEFGRHITVLDRGKTAYRVPGIRYRDIPRYDSFQTARDSHLLQRACDDENADLFISTYYTTPITTPSVFMAYDLIPEVLGADLSLPPFPEKHLAIQHACAYIAISESTAQDLARYFPQVRPENITIVWLGVPSTFSPAGTEELESFRSKHAIRKPYFLIVGDRVGLGGYKNTPLFFRAFSRLPDKDRFAVVCTGGRPEWEPELKGLTSGIDLYHLRLNDDDLRFAYSGARALVYPSRYEGFGLPVAEAMACGCPVITSNTSSLPEVAGPAALYVGPDDIAGLASALQAVVKEPTREALIVAGLQRARRFSWKNASATASRALMTTVEQLRSGSLRGPSPVWEELRWLQGGAAPDRSNLERARVELDSFKNSKFWKLRAAWLRTKQMIGLSRAG